MWSPRNALIALTLLVMGYALATQHAHAASAPLQPANGQVEALQSRVRGLLGQLDEIDELHRDAARGELVQRHWQAMQDFAREVQALLPPAAPGAHASLGPYGSAMGCRLARDMQPDAYLAQVRDLLWSVREKLVSLHESTDPAQRQRLLREVAQSTARGLQLVRGRGWTYESAAPMAAGNPPVPESASQPAYLVRLYCGQCHAPPPPELHSAGEWSAVTAKMQAHMNIADAGNPDEIRRPEAREMDVVLRYLEANACDVAP